MLPFRARQIRRSRRFPHATVCFKPAIPSLVYVLVFPVRITTTYMSNSVRHFQHSCSICRQLCSIKLESGRGNIYETPSTSPLLQVTPRYKPCQRRTPHQQNSRARYRKRVLVFGESLPVQGSTLFEFCMACHGITIANRHGSTP